MPVRRRRCRSAPATGDHGAECAVDVSQTPKRCPVAPVSQAGVEWDPHGSKTPARCGRHPGGGNRDRGRHGALELRCRVPHGILPGFLPVGRADRGAAPDRPYSVRAATLVAANGADRIITRCRWQWPFRGVSTQSRNVPFLRFGPSLFFEKKILLPKLWGCGREVRECGQPVGNARRNARSMTTRACQKLRV